MRNNIITVFGGSGFLGRSVVQRLAQQGFYVRVAVRNTDKANHLRVYGNTGQVMPIQVCLSDKKAIQAVCKNAYGVINLAGRLFEKDTSTFEAVHVKGAQNIAKACVLNDAKHFVHVSALGVDANADSKNSSEYARTKQKGEKKVKTIFPNATIIRPGLLFGDGDHFFSRFAYLAKVFPVLTLFEGGETKLQPVYVGDVAKAIVASLRNSKSMGKTYELAGEKVYSFKNLMELMLKFTNRKNPLISLPSFVGNFMANILQFMPDPLITPDQLKMLKTDSVCHSKKSKNIRGFKDFNITPSSLESIVPTYLSCYKSRF